MFGRATIRLGIGPHSSFRPELVVSIRYCYLVVLNLSTSLVYSNMAYLINGGLSLCVKCC